MNIIYIWLQTDGYLRVDTIVNQTIPYHIPIVQLYYLFNTLIKTWDLMDRQWHPRVTIVIHQKYHIIIRHRQKLTQCKTTHWKYSHAPWVIVNIGKTVNITHISPVLTDYYCCEGAQGVATDVWPFVKEVGHGGRRLWGWGEPSQTTRHLTRGSLTWKTFNCFWSAYTQYKYGS